MPLMHERPGNVDLPYISTVEGIALAQAGGQRRIATSEGASLSGIAEARRKALEIEVMRRGLRR